MRTAILARYSSRMQDEQSIAAQVTEMEAFCRTRNLTITHRFELPETRSADIERTEEWLDMLAAARRRQFDLLLIHKLDRLGRDRETVVSTKAFLRRLGIQVRSVVEDLGDSPMERTMEGMLEVMAEFYSANLGHETRKGHKQLVRQGYFKGGSLPFGLATIEENGHSKIIAHPMTGPTMAEVFQRLAEGQLPRHIRAWLTAQGESWSYPTFYHRIKNPIYHGVIAYGKTTLPTKGPRRRNDPEAITYGEWEGLVSKQLWEEANMQITRRNHLKISTRGKPAKRLYLLSKGVAFCGACSLPLVGNARGVHKDRKGEPTRQYSCSGIRDGKCTCKTRVNADDLEYTVEIVLSRALATMDPAAEWEKRQAELEPGDRSHTQKLEKRLAEVRRRISNLALALEDRYDRAIRDRLDKLRTDEADTLALIQRQAEAEQQPISKEKFLEAFQALTNLVNLAEDESLHEVYRRFTKVSYNTETKQGQLSFQILPLQNTDFELMEPARIYSGRSAQIVPYPRATASWQVQFKLLKTA